MKLVAVFLLIHLPRMFIGQNLAGPWKLDRVKVLLYYLLYYNFGGLLFRTVIVLSEAVRALPFLRIWIQRFLDCEVRQ
jgi:hypothetical protein